jgi:pimeloyl-ACP methyl ester carboxylesterase
MRSIDVPAGVIEYDEVGSGPPVVLLHGLLMDHTLWDRCSRSCPRASGTSARSFPWARTAGRWTLVRT